MVSDKKRISNARWDAANMKLISAKIKKETAEEFQRLCAMNGEPMNTVLKRFIEEYIEQNKPM